MNRDEWCPLVVLFTWVDSLPSSRMWAGHDTPGPSDHPAHYGRNPGAPTRRLRGRAPVPRRAPNGKFLPNGATPWLTDAQEADDVEVCQ